MFSKFALKPTLTFVALILVFISIFSFQRFNAEAEPIKQTDKIIEIEGKDDFDTGNIKNIFKNQIYNSILLTSEYRLGEQTITDYYGKNNNENLDNINKEISEKRLSVLNKLQTSPTEKRNDRKLTDDDFRKSVDENTFIGSEIKVKKLKITSKDTDSTKILEKVKGEKNIKSFKDDQVVFSKNKFTEQLDNATITANNLLNPISADAQTSTADYIPDYTDVSFYDANEIGMYPQNNFTTTTPNGNTQSQPSAASGNGRTFILHRGINNGLYLGNYDSNGNDFKGWQDISGGKTTNASPSVEWYYGRLYVIMKDSSNNIFYRYSTDSGVTWTNWTQADGQVFDIEMKRHNNRLYLLGRGTDNRLYMRYQDNGSNVWSVWALLGTKTTFNKPVLASYFGRLYSGIRSNTGSAIVNTNSETWSDTNWKTIRNVTADSFGMAGYNNRLCFLMGKESSVDSSVTRMCSTDLNLNSVDYPIKAYISTSYAPTLNADYKLMQVVVGGNAPADYLSTKISLSGLSAYSGSRGYLSNMKWNSPKGSLGGFKINNTYEQKISLAKGPNSNNQTYLDRNTSPWPNCFPSGSSVYITSSLPSSYVDVRVEEGINGNGGVCDNSGTEITYTVGTSKPFDITPSALYFNYFETGAGDRNNPIFQLRSQKGEMRPDNCFNAILCPTAISNTNRYTCNSTGGDVFCSWMNNCSSTPMCVGQTLIPYDDNTLTYNNASVAGTRNMSRSITYPYWFRSFTK
jgi:hypothetical protein